MSARRVVVALAVLAATRACYSAPDVAADHCEIACATTCPGDLTCEAASGRCVASGETCVTVPPAPTYTQVGIGSRHACALTSDGHVLCWGDNSDGQLGVSALAQTGTPTAVGDATTMWTALAVGAEHTCGLHDRAPYCWGENQVGQAAGGAGGIVRDPMPVPLGAGAPSFDAITAGAYHACALGGGDAWCWGGADQVGSAVTTATLVPPPASEPGAKWSALAAGTSHTCAISTDGGVACWGDNESGQTGQPAQSTMPQPPLEVALPANHNAIRIAAGDQSTCAVLAIAGGDQTAGELWCWGTNTNGVIDPANGVGEVLAPTQIGSDADWTAIAVNEAVTCGVRAGQSACWGNSNDGGLGDGYWSEDDPVLPTAPRLLGSADEIALSQHAPNDDDVRDELGCLRAGGTIQCWGDNRDGGVGDGLPAMTSHARAVPPPSSLTWLHVYAGEQHTCAQASDQSLWCWGADYYGQVRGGIGRGVTQACVTNASCDAPTPTAAPRLDLDATANAPDAVVAGSDYSCVLQAHEIWCWGYNGNDQLGVSPTTGYNAVEVGASTAQGWSAISGRSAGTCAVDAASSNVACWGYYNNGTGAPTPAQPAGSFGSTTSFQLGPEYSCGLENGERSCWGDDSVCELGNGNVNTVSAPVEVEGGIAAMALDDTHGCEITMTGSALACWGEGTYGEAGVTDSSQINCDPIAIKDPAGTPLTECTAVAVGPSTSCAICGGTPSCWGANDRDQLGRLAGASSPTSTATPVDLPLGQQWLEISVGAAHACALDAAHGLYCWGDGGHGTLGDGSQSHNLPTTIVTPH